MTVTKRTLDQSRVVTSFKATTRRLFEDAREQRWDHATLIRHRADRILATTPYRKLLRVVDRAYLEGYYEGLWDQLYLWLEHHYLFDGKVYPDGDRLRRDAQGRWSEVKFVGMFYPGTDVPFDLKEG